ncbi:phenylacetate--CoA ligase family protein [Curtobacterium sp. PhB136]|uniref:phenylacetate--CoA ligase family protein n=1 Tax=Curtobacterium sp. PhB136 TaxID=2485181 RepID=UPI0010512791|nr:phenylacetate--CoA ligase family protein [Curtobacterium sp. PhB136]TCK65759.1 phenylacetate-CoA ligase [Curtobacterium sp. PhB136]
MSTINITETAPIRNVEADAARSEEIEPFIRYSQRKKAESRPAQARLRRRWDFEKRHVRRAVWQLEQETDRAQLLRIRELVDRAFVSHRFYRDLYASVGYEPGAIVTWDDYEALPVINKRALIDGGFGEDVEAMYPAGMLHSARTSGSSGLNMTIYQDDASVEYRHVLYMRHCELMLRDTLQPTDWRYGIYFVAERYTSLLGDYPFVTVSQDVPVDILIRNLAEVRPRLVLTLPSALQRLAETRIDLQEFGVQAVGTNSERSTKEERLHYSDTLGVPVLDEYSSEEMSLIAYECGERRYHLVEDSGRFDVHGADEEGYGHLVGTSFGNASMPFIRYDQGDVVQIGQAGSQCPCGSRFRVLTSFRGREDEALADGQGTVAADAVLGLCDATLVDAEANVLQYQIVQTARDRVVLRAQPIDRALGLETRPVRKFVATLPSLFENVRMNVTVEQTDDFDRFASGKRRLIIVAMDGAR